MLRNEMLRDAKIAAEVAELYRQIQDLERQLENKLTALKGKSDAPAGVRAGTPSALLVEILREKPGCPIQEIAKYIYGNDERSTQNKTRSLLATSKRRGLVEQMSGVGRWKVVDSLADGVKNAEEVPPESDETNEQIQDDTNEGSVVD